MSTITALLLAADGPRLVELESNDLSESVQRLVGDPMIDCLRPASDLELWVGDNSLATSARNVGASWVYEQVIRAIARGDLPGTSADRTHASYLIESSNWKPVIHGPCLVTGLDGPAIAELPRGFLTWFNRLASAVIADELAQRLQEATAELGFTVVGFSVRDDTP